MNSDFKEVPIRYISGRPVRFHKELAMCSKDVLNLVLECDHLGAIVVGAKEVEQVEVCVGGIAQFEEKSTPSLSIEKKNHVIYIKSTLEKIVRYDHILLNVTIPARLFNRITIYCAKGQLTIYDDIYACEMRLFGQNGDIEVHNHHGENLYALNHEGAINVDGIFKKIDVKTLYSPVHISADTIGDTTIDIYTISGDIEASFNGIGRDDVSLNEDESVEKDIVLSDGKNQIKGTITSVKGHISYTLR